MTVVVASWLPWPFDREYMQMALAAGLVVGICAPLIGVFLVQQRLSLMGDGIGHVALTGVALGLLTGTFPVLTAVIVATAGAVAIEVVRMRGRSPMGDEAGRLEEREPGPQARGYVLDLGNDPDQKLTHFRGCLRRSYR